jgi:hypothetical protein
MFGNELSCNVRNVKNRLGVCERSIRLQITVYGHEYIEGRSIF